MNDWLPPLQLPTVMLGDIPLLHPWKLPAYGRLWTFFPLALCVALVYRATRQRDLTHLPRRTFFTFVNICAGMIAIALVAFGIHEAVLYFG